MEIGNSMKETPDERHREEKRVSLLVVIEGIDGSGKGTQAARLRERLQRRKLRVGLLSFPRYEATFFGRRIGDFLNKRFGDLHEVDPFLASLLYAGDRFESRGELLRQLSENDVLILDRYVPSNMAHQAGKQTGEARRQLSEWIETVEYEIYGLPRPDLVILLDTPAQVSQELIARKAQRTYTAEAADMQEADSDHLSQTRTVYCELAAERGWSILPVTVGGQLRPIDHITDDVENLVRQSLIQRGAWPAES